MTDLNMTDLNMIDLNMTDLNMIDLVQNSIGKIVGIVNINLFTFCIRC